MFIRCHSSIIIKRWALQTKHLQMYKMSMKIAYLCHYMSAILWTTATQRQTRIQDPVISLCLQVASAKQIMNSSSKCKDLAARLQVSSWGKTLLLMQAQPTQGKSYSIPILIVFQTTCILNQSMQVKPHMVISSRVNQTKIPQITIAKEPSQNNRITLDYVLPAKKMKISQKVDMEVSWTVQISVLFQILCTSNLCGIAAAEIGQLKATMANKSVPRHLLHRNYPN